MRKLVFLAAMVGLLILLLLWQPWDTGRRSRNPSVQPDSTVSRTAAGPRDRTPPPDVSVTEASTPEAPQENAAPSATLSGTVVRVDGQPVAGARVHAWGSRGFEWSRDAEPVRTTTADGLGAFTLEGLRGPLVIAADAEGLACRQALIGTLAPNTNARGATIVMDAAHAWKGRVVDADGQPVRGATLRTWPVETLGQRSISTVPGFKKQTPTSHRTLSDVDGGFAVGPLPHGAWSLVVEHPDHAPWTGRFPTDADYFEVRLERGVTVAGVVRRTDGSVVEGAVVEAYAMGPMRQCVTGADGRFRVRGLRDGPLFYLTVRASGAARNLHEVAKHRRESIEIRLEPACVLAGVVVDGEQRPLPGVRVSIESRRRLARGFGGTGARPVTSALGGTITETDAHGRFRYDDLFPDRYTVHVWDKNDKRQFAKVEADAGSEDLRIVFQPKHETVLSGTVRDAVTGKPVPKFELHVQARKGGAGGSVSLESEDGSFRWAGAKIHDLRLRVRAAGYAAWMEPWVHVGTGEKRYDIRLHRPASLFLRAINEEGESFTDFVAVQFELPNGTPVLPSQRSGIALKDGAWSGHGLPRTAIRLVFVTGIVENWYTRWEFDLDLRELGGQEREIVVDRTAGKRMRPKKP